MNTALITGAGSGIGLATAKHFQQQGWNVAATLHHPNEDGQLDELDDVICPHLDVTDPTTINAAIAETIDRFGSIDAIVNNAGLLTVGPFEAATHEQIVQQFEVNVFGTMNVIKAVLPHFRENGGGTIINISSLGGKIAIPLQSLYHGTKWAVEGFSESLRFELEPHNIKVRLIEPGMISTPLYDDATVFSDEQLGSYDEYVKTVVPNLLNTGEEGSDPEGVAETVFEAATDRGNKLRYPTGKSAASLVLLSWLLPDNWFDAMIERHVTKA